MSYKTILVHLNRVSRAETILEPVVDMARKNNAHVIGVYLQPRIQAAVAVDALGNPNMLLDELKLERENGDAIGKTFERMTKGQPFTAEWRDMPATVPDFAGNLLDQAVTADLVVASQNDPDWNQSGQLDFPERLILESGRPVLAIPYVGHYRIIGQTVVVAWKPGRESSRAVFNAIPLMQHAKIVHILQIAEKREKLQPATDLVAALARHGVKAELQMSQAVDQSVGNELLSRIADLGTDLLVMGAYGHSRMREYVFGGATRDVIKTMTVPTVFSH